MTEQVEPTAFVATATASLEAIRSLGIDWRNTLFRRYIDRVARQAKYTKTPIDNLLVEGTCQLLHVDARIDTVSNGHFLTSYGKRAMAALPS